MPAPVRNILHLIKTKFNADKVMRTESTLHMVKLSMEHGRKQHEAQSTKNKVENKDKNRKLIGDELDFASKCSFRGKRNIIKPTIHILTVGRYNR